MQYQEFDDETYTDLRKRLLKKKGGASQKAFLTALKNKDSFIEYVENEIKIKKGGETPCFSRPLTEYEFKTPPKGTERELFDLWKEVTPASACRVTFWAMVTFQHIKEGKIEPSFLAADGSLQSGRQRIDQALKQGNVKEIDGIVRTAIRRMSGLPEARGNRSVYVNCSFARAWWRCYLTEEVCKCTSAQHNSVHRILCSSQDYWERLITFIVSRNSVLGDSKVRVALIWALSNRRENKDLFVGKNLEKLTRRIGIRSAWQELGVFSVEELKQIIEENFPPDA